MVNVKNVLKGLLLKHDFKSHVFLIMHMYDVRVISTKDKMR